MKTLQDIITIPDELPLTVMWMKRSGTNGALCVAAEPMKGLGIDGSYADMLAWGQLERDYGETDNEPDWFTVANGLANQIAVKTRRATANYIFVQNEAVAEQINAKGNRFEVIVDPSLHTREVRATYFVPRLKMFAAMDGGMAIQRGQLYIHPHFQQYFARTIVPKSR